MEIIPLIYIKSRKKYSDYKNNNILSDDEIIKELSENKNLYLYDIDGIKGNKPNLCTYQRFSSLAELWIDAAPRDLGDVVDNLMAGGNKIIIQEKKWIDKTFSEIKKITQNNIFYRLDFENKNPEFYEIISKPEIDGVVVLNNYEFIRNDYTIGSYIKNLAEKTTIYGFEDNPKDISYWKEINAKGVFVEIDKIKEFKKIK
jgi:hypothetical protein